MFMSDFSENERLRVSDFPGGWPVMRQVWRHVGFLHWPVEIPAIVRRLPPGLEVDTFEGVAYVGIVPFTIPTTRVAVVGPRMTPAFHEINLRTYVHHAGRNLSTRMRQRWFEFREPPRRLATSALVD